MRGDKIILKVDLANTERVLRGFNKKQLAAECGLSEQSVVAAMNGAIVGLTVASKIARALGLNLRDIVAEVVLGGGAAA